MIKVTPVVCFSRSTSWPIRGKVGSRLIQ